MAQFNIPSGKSESRYHVSVEIPEKISWITISQEEEIRNLSWSGLSFRICCYILDKIFIPLSG